MSEKPPKTTLHVVGEPGATQPSPPSTFGEAGQRLWNAVQAEFDVSDVAGRELLGKTCRAADRAESLAARILLDGEVIRTKSGLRAHPALPAELAARSFVVKTLLRLGINFEPLRLGPGRPSGRGA
jgi:hypothetical protein